jgi:serine/threonine protein kinase
MAQEKVDAEKLSPNKQAAARVGTDLNAKWRIDKVLGVGGMGAVFACTHKNNGTRAAIKVLHVEYSRAIDVRERFLKEGRIANKVNHPARVQVTDDGVSDLGEPFLVMELLEGMTLAELFRRGGGRMPIDKLLSIFDTVLDLLAKCHELDIVHRDIKPANIFLTKQGPVRVLDFGVARMREPEVEGQQATRAGIALGTASFIAPEQALGMEKVDGRADLFSVGACLYAGLTGERLHAAKTEAEEFVLAATQAAPSVARKAKELPPEVVAFVDKSLAYDKNQRFATAAEMRGELLKITAGLRSGQIKATGKKATGIVVRGKDAIEEGPPFESEQQMRDALLKLTSIFKHLGLAMASVRQYGFSHPQTKRALGQGYHEIGVALAQSPYNVRWDVTASGFTFEGHPVWMPDRVPFDRIPHQLFADGIRKVQFKQGITEEELRDFLVILMRDVSSLFAAEDDSVTAMWDRRFEHVAYLAIDSFAEGDAVGSGEDAAEWNELADRAIAFARIDKDFEDVSLEAQAAELNVGHALREAGEAAASLSIDPMTRATLGAQIAVPPERWLESFLMAFVPAYVEVERRGDAAAVQESLKEWTADQVKLHAVQRVFEVHQAMAAAFGAQTDPETAKRIELETAKLMFPVETLRAVMTDIAAERWTNDGVPLEAPRELVRGLSRALELLASDAVFALALECLDSSRSSSLKEVLVPYVRRWAHGQESALAAMLPTAGPDLGKTIIELLVELKTPAALQGVESALLNPNLEVKLAALAHTGESIGDRARDEITNLLDSPDVQVRLRTLDLVGQMSVVAAGPVLVRRIQSDVFHDLSVDERRRWLSTVSTLKASRGESIAIELLSKRKLLASDAAEESRVLAAEHLATADSPEALEALETASKQRWGTSAHVREAATRALEIIRARKEAREGKRAAAEGKPMEGKA